MQEQLSNEKKILILEAARKRFAYYGFSKVTMDEIAADVGMGKASLYYYFPTKESIFMLVIKEEADQFISNIEKIIEQNIPADKMLRLYVSERLEYFKKLANLRGLLFQVENDSRTTMFEKFKEFHEEETRLLMQILQIGKKHEEFSFANTKKTAVSILQMLYGARAWHIKMMQDKIDENTFAEMRSAMKDIIEIILNGILKR